MKNIEKQTIEFELNTSYMAVYPKQRTSLNHYDKLESSSAMRLVN